jgi:hypothetical protein
MVDKIRRLLAWQARKRFETTLSDWEKIFYNSRANGAEYTGDRLPANHIDWEQLKTRLRKGVENE